MSTESENNELEKRARRKHQRQVETPVPGQPGLRVAVYPSGRRTYILRYRDPVTGKKTSMTLGVLE